VKVAVLFPGQGVEPSVIELRDRTIDLRRSSRTELLQPALAEIGLAIAGELRSKGVKFDLALGHSAGEVSALAIRGVIDPRDAIALARIRGELMSREAKRDRGGMSALLTDRICDVRKALRIGRSAGRLYLGGRNAPGQWVLSGEIAALRAVSARFSARALDVDGPWHSPMIAGAVAPLYRAALRMMRPAHAEELALALVRPMRFARAIARAIEDGITDVVIAGPGKIAQALVRANSVDVRIHRTERIADRARIAEVLRR